jgi:hypothetical protein
MRKICSDNRDHLSSSPYPVSGSQVLPGIEPARQGAAVSCWNDASAILKCSESPPGYDSGLERPRCLSNSPMGSRPLRRSGGAESNIYRDKGMRVAIAIDAADREAHGGKPEHNCPRFEWRCKCITQPAPKFCKPRTMRAKRYCTSRSRSISGCTKSVTKGSSGLKGHIFDIGLCYAGRRIAFRRRGH